MAAPSDYRDREDERDDTLRQWRGFQRARHALWLAVAMLVPVGALLHEWISESSYGRLVWGAVTIAMLGAPAAHLLAFRCPGCGEPYLATGRLRDLWGLCRIFWSTRCSHCSLPEGHVAESRPDGPSR